MKKNIKFDRILRLYSLLDKISFMFIGIERSIYYGKAIVAKYSVQHPSNNERKAVVSEMVTPNKKPLISLLKEKLYDCFKNVV